MIYILFLESVECNKVFYDTHVVPQKVAIFSWDRRWKQSQSVGCKNVKYVKRQISSGCQAFILVPALSFQSSNRFMVKYFIGWKMCNGIRNIQTWFLTELVLYPWNEKYKKCENETFMRIVIMRQQIIFNLLAARTLLRNSIPPGTHGKHKWPLSDSQSEPRHLESNDYSPSLNKKCVIVLPRVERHLILWEAFIPVTTFTSKSLSNQL